MDCNLIYHLDNIVSLSRLLCDLTYRLIGTLVIARGCLLGKLCYRLRYRTARIRCYLLCNLVYSLIDICTCSSYVDYLYDYLLNCLLHRCRRSTCLLCYLLCYLSNLLINISLSYRYLSCLLIYYLGYTAPLSCLLCNLVYRLIDNTCITCCLLSCKLCYGLRERTPRVGCYLLRYLSYSLIYISSCISDLYSYLVYYLLHCS